MEALRMGRELIMDSERMKAFRRSVRVEQEIVDAELTNAHAEIALYRARKTLDWAKRSWVGARREALEAWRAHLAAPADEYLLERYKERWDSCKTAYAALKLARRAIEPLRALVEASEGARAAARAYALGAAERGEYDEDEDAA